MRSEIAQSEREKIKREDGEPGWSKAVEQWKKESRGEEGDWKKDKSW